MFSHLLHCHCSILLAQIVLSVETRATLIVYSEDDVQVSAVILGLNSPTDLCVHWGNTR